MIIHGSIPHFDLPERVEPKTAELVVFPNGDPKKNPDSYAVPMYRIELKFLAEIREKKNYAGIPSYYAFDASSKRLEFWPLPDRDYLARFRYMPALKEI